MIGPINKTFRLCLWDFFYVVVKVFNILTFVFEVIIIYSMTENTKIVIEYNAGVDICQNHLANKKEK